MTATREPGGTMLGNRLREIFVDPASGKIDPLAEALLLNASRAQLLAEVIRPALEAGKWVLCDRYAHATLAYQGYGRGVDLELLRTVTSVATKGLAPDVVLLVDVPEEISRQRVLARARASGVPADRVEREDGAFHRRVREGYLALAREDDRMVILDGTQSVEELLDRAWEIVHNRMPVAQ